MGKFIETESRLEIIRDCRLQKMEIKKKKVRRRNMYRKTESRKKPHL